ncbi:IucA/IucC family protein [Nocardia sp. NPDC052254]|uniref:IucA/IucC family protein n=1 Tax=Nocardia sp. NPDC052254 TaxID=3155681 RepID=UPI00341DAD71
MSPRRDPAPTTGTLPAALPTADDIVTHTLLNCLLREVSGPEHQARVLDDHLLLRLPRRDVLLRVRLRRVSMVGAHRFTGPVSTRTRAGWVEVSWEQLAEYVHTELTLYTGVGNDEFLDQVASTHRTTTIALRSHATRTAEPAPDYLASEQSLLFGHRYHPTPKARSGAPESWQRYSPETASEFGLRLLAVRSHLIAEETADPAACAALDDLYPQVPHGYRLLPAHPWQFEMLRTDLEHAIDRGDIVDLGVGPVSHAATASVRTLYDGRHFLKFSLNIRITNCVRKNAAYELAGAVALTRILAPALADLRRRFPAAVVLREPAYRSLALPGPDGTIDQSLLEGFGVIIRDGLDTTLLPGTTPLLAAAIADEYPTSAAQVSRLLADNRPETALRWWTDYLRLLVPPVLAAFFDHGMVLEPHLQNVVVAVDSAGMPAQIFLRDLEGTKLLADHHGDALARTRPDVAARMTYSRYDGWNRVVYCLVVNHLSEMAAALADVHPHLESALWDATHTVLSDCADTHGCPPRMAALLAGVPLPAKANLLTRWERKADRDAGYVRIPSPWAPRQTERHTTEHPRQEVAR